MPGGSSWILLLCLAPQQPIEDPVDLGWRPADGRVVVLCAGGARLMQFDAELRPVRPVAELPLPGPRFDAVACRAGVFRLRDPDGAWRVLDGTPLAVGPGETAEAASLRLQVMAGRALQVDGDGVLRLGLAPWEHAGEVEWGPGWATVRFRCSRRLGPFLQWRRPGGPLLEAAVVPDRRDPLLQRAYLEPVHAGERIELRHRPVTRTYPSRAWSAWVELRVPEVEPAGARPVTVLRRPATSE